MASLWERLDRLLLTADPHLLAVHRLDALAASRYRAAGRQVPPALARAERTGALLSLLAPTLLARVREACDGPLLVIKGPATAAHYPDPALRPYRDLDLVVPDAPRTQKQLVAAGFDETGTPAVFAGGPHERPLHPGELPVYVEVHHAPNWPRKLPPPPASELIARAAPAELGVDGFLELRPAAHAVLLAAHSWTHGPVARLRDLVDVAAVLAAADGAEADAVARAWGVARLWRTFRALSDAVLDGRSPPLPLRLWAGNLADVRERTVLESHLGLWLAGFSALPPGRALAELVWRVGDDLRPAPGERWSTKLRRTRRALRNLARSKSEHDRAIDPATEGGARLPPRRDAR